MTALTIGMMTVDTTDALALARWWVPVVDGTVLEENDGWYVMVRPAAGAPVLAFQRVEDPTPGKNRLHLDLVAPDRAAAVADLLGRGATLVAEHEVPGLSWTVLADPDGNQFCVAQRG